MYNILKRNWDKTKYILLSGFIIIFLLLLTVVYKSDEKITKISENNKNLYDVSDLKAFKQFILDQIKSPFTNIDYEIKKGDTIQKILQQYKIQNNEIQAVINQYKKYGNPNRLLVGNKIDIIVEKTLPANKNLLLKFSVPITKSTTIEITKDSENQIISKKIITKLYKKKILSENIIPPGIEPLPPPRLPSWRTLRLRPDTLGRSKRKILFEKSKNLIFQNFH